MKVHNGLEQSVSGIEPRDENVPFPKHDTLGLKALKASLAATLAGVRHSDVQGFSETVEGDQDSVCGTSRSSRPASAAAHHEGGRSKPSKSAAADRSGRTTSKSSTAPVASTLKSFFASQKSRPAKAVSTTVEASANDVAAGGESTEEEISAKIVLQAVYGRQLSDDETLSVLTACREVGWLVQCYCRNPLPPGWRKSKVAPGDVPLFANEATGTVTETPPFLEYYTQLSNYVIQTYHNPKTKSQLVAWTKQIARDAFAVATGLTATWTGPHLDPASGAEYYYCRTQAFSSWEHPCTWVTFVACVAEKLLESEALRLPPAPSPKASADSRRTPVAAASPTAAAGHRGDRATETGNVGVSHDDQMPAQHGEQPSAGALGGSVANGYASNDSHSRAAPMKASESNELDSAWDALEDLASMHDNSVQPQVSSGWNAVEELIAKQSVNKPAPIPQDCTSTAGYSKYSPPVAADIVTVPPLALPKPSGAPRVAAEPTVTAVSAATPTVTANAPTAIGAAPTAVTTAAPTSIVETQKPRGLSALPPPPKPVPKMTPVAQKPSAGSPPDANVPLPVTPDTTSGPTGGAVESGNASGAAGVNRAELMALAGRLRDLVPSVEAGGAERAAEVREVLTSLELLTATLDDLRESQLGLLTQKIKDCPDPQIREIVKRLRKSWKDVLKS